ncbi:MAG: S9 family peptidase [Gemmataceae bacterium]|nr:S9 family peptidase [Gemmataceae bacterium]
MIRRVVIALVVVVGVAAPSAAQTKRPITVEDLWKVQRLGKPAISPDGKWVAVEVTTYSLDDNAGDSDLWLFSTDGKVRRQLTTAKGKDSGPAWSPDSKTIAFVSKRAGDVAQIHLIAPGGGEARQLSKLPMAPSGLKWAPDGKSVFCIVQTWPDTPDDESFKKKEKTRKDDKVQAYIIDDALYRYWDHWIADGKRPVIFRVDLESGQHTNLFAGLKLFLPVANASADSYDIAPDGKELCFTADSTKEIGMDFNLDLYTLALDANAMPQAAVKNLTTDNPVGDFNPVYSPDGKWLAYTRQAIKFFYADRSRLMLRDRDSGATRELTENLDRSVASLQWMADNQRLGFEAEDAGYRNIFFTSIKGNDAKKFPTPGVSEFAFDVARHTRLAAFLTTSFDLPATLFVHGPKGAARQLSHVNDDLVKQWDLGEVKNVAYKGADDEDVQMWIVHPPKFDPAKKWPLLMIIHGGPHNGITTDFHFRWNLHLFASKGYVVACPNFHGSSGFGQKFTDSITGDMSTKPFIDVMKATDYMEALPYIDKDRTAAAGASYGGFMMAWINGHTDRYKALVCHAGVYNWHSMMASDIVRSRERPLGAMPWGDLKQIDKQSPQRFAANFKTPTLIMHGEKDFRVPVTQGFEYYNTLRIKGVPTRLVYFPDENHWVMKPQNSRLWHREFFAWIEKYIGSGPTR